MNHVIYFSICSLFYSLLLIVVFFSKKRLKSIENKVYIAIMLVNFLCIILELSMIFTAMIRKQFPVLNMLVAKCYLVGLLLWLTIFTFYVFVISHKNEGEDAEKLKKYYKKTFLCCFLVLFILLITLAFLPIYYYTPPDKKIYTYTYGPSIQLVFIASAFCIVIWLSRLFKNFSEIKNKKYYPLIAFIIGGGLVASIQAINPSLTLTTAMETFVTFLMYFTIENPDLKMIAELEIARKQAERANAAKTDFLSNMSHEIRTPLNAIVGFSQSLSEENLPDSTREKARDILMASDNLLEIVNGILDISKIEANKLEIVNTEYDMHKVFDELVLLTKARIGEKAIDFRYHLDSSIPAVLYGDYVRLKQIILNLLTNAAKYTKEGFIDFKISTIQSGNVCRLIISVEDSVFGIKQDKINKLFMKFERLDLEKNITIEGTGLGLAITKRLVELMHGRVVVQSVYGKGSKFTVAIDQKIVSEKVGVSKQVEDTPLSVGGKKVLLVDDNKLNLKVASMLLSKYELDITQVGSGYEAIDQILAQKQYDLILLDDMMPKMSGVETLQKLKGIDGFSTPVVVLTANAISGMREKYLKDGFQDYLAKPIDKAELEKVIRKYLN